MGPLVTQGIIDPAWNNLIALLVGMAFGFILESSGFSSSRKLAGVFYGYDFVVLKVFFTAAITAALGLLLMSSIGMIDLSKIFINPTFLGPGIVGGIIMGFGFIMGGYCPGTSFCGAAIGKIDAIIFTLGMFVGILIFSELFPLYSDFFTSGAMGNILVTDVLGIPAGLFVLLLTIVAVGAFYVTGIIEKRVNNPKS
ncbi:MAG: YeeE/YedE family protein [Sphingobacteriia bacterium]|nr:YeeE/YedE family protein [Sphingobacteriia bacterium]